MSCDQSEQQKIEALRNQFLEACPPPIPFALFRLLPAPLTAPYMMRMMNFITSRLD